MRSSLVGVAVLIAAGCAGVKTPPPVDRCAAALGALHSEHPDRGRIMVGYLELKEVSSAPFKITDDTGGTVHLPCGDSLFHAVGDEKRLPSDSVGFSVWFEPSPDGGLDGLAVGASATVLNPSRPGAILLSGTSFDGPLIRGADGGYDIRHRRSKIRWE